MNNRIIQTITKCLLCNKTIEVRPIDYDERVPQFRMRCKKHEKELKRVWPTKFNKFWELINDS